MLSLVPGGYDHVVGGVAAIAANVPVWESVVDFVLPRSRHFSRRVKLLSPTAIGPADGACGIFAIGPFRR